MCTASGAISTTTSAPISSPNTTRRRTGSKGIRPVRTVAHAEVCVNHGPTAAVLHPVQGNSREVVIGGGAVGTSPDSREDFFDRFAPHAAFGQHLTDDFVGETIALRPA